MYCGAPAGPIACFVSYLDGPGEWIPAPKQVHCQLRRRVSRHERGVRMRYRATHPNSAVRNPSQYMRSSSDATLADGAPRCRSRSWLPSCVQSAPAAQKLRSSCTCQVRAAQRLGQRAGSPPTGGASCTAENWALQRQQVACQNRPDSEDTRRAKVAAAACVR